MVQNNDILNRIKLLMEYDMSMTYGENLALVYEQRVSDVPTQQKTVNTTPKLASNIGYGKQPNNQIQKTVNYPKGFVESKGWVVDGKKVEIKGTNIREILLNLRNFLFETNFGLVTDIIISTAGVEVGGPIIIKALEFAILANDIDIYSEQSQEFKNRGFFEKFSDEQNNSFSNVIQDIIVIATLGVIRSIGKIRKALKTNPNLIKESISKCKEFFTSVRSVLGELGSIGEWLGSKLTSVINFLDSLVTTPKVKNLVSNKVRSIPTKFSKYLDDVSRTVPKHISSAVVEAVAGVIIFEVGSRAFERIKNTKLFEKILFKVVSLTGEPKPDIEIIKETENETILALKQDNPDLTGPIKIIDEREGIFEIGKPPKRYTFIDMYSHKLKPI